jgi:transitional endoplasmic reticulum ATPase
MAPTNPFFAATASSSDGVFGAFQSHTNAPRIETRTMVLNMIRMYYRDFHVTEVDERKVSLFEYAGADKAKLVHDGDDEFFMSTKGWRAVGEGIEKKTHPGKLQDDFRYAR